MPEIALVAVIVAVAATGLFAALGSRPLLGWYLREVRRLKIREEPGDAIITYPLA
jgi:hypothetical protein